MSYRKYRKKNYNDSAMTVHVVCAIVFVLFSWCWIYYFQHDLLAMAQHVLSGGLTHYNRLIGAVVITITLLLLQRFVFKLIRLGKSFYALTFFPSFLSLGMITNIVPEPDGGINHQFSGWLGILLLLLWGGAYYMATKLQELDDEPNPNVFSRTMWVNMLILVFMMIITAGVGNTNAVFHYRMKAENCLLHGDLDGALIAGKKSLECDDNLVMLRMQALARKDALGEKLFEYKVCGSSKTILPTDSQSTLLLYPVDSIYKYFKAVPAYKMEPMHYLKLVQRRDSVPRKSVTDYLLSGYLIDKDIDTFAREVGKYYSLNDSLPKHYREAMVLYTHLRSKPMAVYRNAVMDEDYANFRELRSKYPRKMEQKGKVEEQYFGTYWYYYWYE